MFDSHYHLDQSIVPLPNLIEAMDQAGIEKTALIPAICPELKNLPKPVQLTLPMFRKFIHGPPGIFKKIIDKIYSGAVIGECSVNLMGTKYKLFPRPDNDVVAEAVKKYPDRFVGFCFVNPSSGESSVEVAEKYLAKPGIIGVKAHPFWHDFPVSALNDVAALCQEKDKPMLLHLGIADRGDFESLHRNFPTLTVIYAHLGIPRCHDMLEVMKRHDRIFMDMSNTEYSDAPNARKCISSIGPERILFGSDGPYMIAENKRFDYGPILRVVDEMRLSNAELEKVGGGNFHDIIGD